MGWRERLQPASFRGVSFYVDRVLYSGGRRYAVHEFPQRDAVFAEDLGARAREYSFDAYLLGDDYDIELEELRRAAEKHPLGYPYRTGSTLVHPELGLRRVICTAIRTEVSAELGRIGRARMTFLEVEDQPEPTPVPNHTGKTDAAGAALALESSSSALASLEVQAVPAAVSEALADDIESLAKLMSSLDVFTGLAKDVAAYAAKVTALIAQASALATSAAELVGAVIDAVDAIIDAAGNAFGALSAYEAILGGFSASSHDSPTSTIQGLQNTNGELLESLVHSAALSGAVSSAARVNWTSLEAALERRAVLLAFIEARMATASDQEYLALERLRSALVSAVPRPGQDLPSVEEITIPAPIPVLALSYRLYGRDDRAADIVDRNKIANENFVPAGSPLEVLSDATDA
jgi:prophage DNA circulation protein